VYRSSSIEEEFWYYETIVWSYNIGTKKRGKIVDMQDSGINKAQALNKHLEIIEWFTNN